MIDSNISHDEFVSKDYVLKKYDEMKKETQNSNNITFFLVLNVQCLMWNRWKNWSFICPIDCGFKKFENIDEEVLSYLLEDLI